MYPFVDSSVHAVLVWISSWYTDDIGQLHVLCAKGFYAIKQYMQLSVISFVGLIVMHMYVGSSELHWMKFVYFLIFTFCL